MQDMLRLVLDTSPNCVFVKDGQGRYVLVNRAIADLYATSRESMIGHTDEELLSASQEDARRFVRDDRRVLDTEQEVVIPKERFLLPNGSVKWFRTVKTPIVLPSGATCVLGIAVDITTQTETEEALRERQRMLDQTGAMARIGGWEYDLETGKAVWTRALYDIMELDYNASPPGLDEHLLHYPPASRTVLEEAYRGAVNQGIPFDLELDVYTAKREPLRCRVYGEPAFQNDNCVRLRGTIQDISARKGAEDALRESEEKYRLLAENTLDCIWVMNMEFVFTYVNPAVKQMMGYTVEEWQGSRLTDHCDPEHFAQVHEYLKKAIRKLPDNSPILIETEMIGKGGQPVPVDIVAKLLVDERGKPVAFQAMSRNIAERKRAERELQKALLDTQTRERQIAMLLESAQAVMECQTCEEALQRVFDACREATGASSGYVALLTPDGANSDMVVLDTGGCPCGVNPDLAMPIRGLRAEAYSLRDAVYENDFPNSEWARFIPTGHTAVDNILFAPLLVDDRAVGLLGLANKPGGFGQEDARLAMVFSQQAAIALRNARDREALAASEAKYRSYVNTSPVAIFIVDHDGHHLEVNEAACTLLGYACEELLAMGVSDVDVPDEERSLGEAFDLLKRNGRFSGEQSLRRKDGQPVRVALDATALEDGRYMWFCADITTRVSLEEQLRHAQRMEAVGRLAGGIAHDFNNILQTIMGYSQMLSDEMEEGTDFHEFVHEIVTGAERAAALTRQLLAFSRRQVLTLEDLNLNEVIEALAKMLGRVIGEDVRLSFMPGRDLGTVRADRGQMEQILMNLAVNARDAMPGGGVLTIETENIIIDTPYCETHAWAQPGRYVLLSVTDTGCGMDSETMAHAFEPFFTTKDTGQGTGLGLATVHGIVNQHSGMINVYSEVEKGTMFKVYLPLVNRPALTVGSKVIKRASGGTETILLVEDDEMVRQLGNRVLMHAGYTVLSAVDGMDALRVFRENSDRIDLVLLDVVMPELSGRGVYDELRKTYPDLKFLFTSGYSTNAIHTDFVLQEGIEFVQKPYSPNALLRKVREILDRDDQASE